MSAAPVLALAATPRDWAARLHRQVADHGGARIRATVLTAAEALVERYDVLLADDRTSFLSQRLIRSLQDSGRLVVGLYDPGDPQGKSDLVDWGVDEALPSDLPPGELLAAVQSLVPRRPAERRQAPGEPVTTAAVPALGDVAGAIVVRGPGGGAGRTEVALSLAAELAAAGGKTVLVELDEARASLAPRLGLPPYPNLRAAIDWSRRGPGSAGAAVQRASAGLGVLVAGPVPQSLGPAPGDDLLAVLADVARGTDWVVVDAGEAWAPAPVTATVLVGAATPVGAVRLNALLAAQADAGHVVVNRAPASAYRRWEFLDELRRVHAPRSITTVPEDRNVFDASWRGRPAQRGPFARAMRGLARRIAEERGAAT